MTYDYVVVDSKLHAYHTYHRKKPITTMISDLATMLQKFTYGRIVFAHDMDKSAYRLQMWDQYKGNRIKDTNDRHTTFIDQYTTALPTVLSHIGTNAIFSGVEADDTYHVIRTMFPDAKVLLLSLDLDWLLNVDQNTHLYFHTTGMLYTTPYNVSKKIGVSPHLYTTMVALGGQAKDNILNLQNLGKVRFHTYLVDNGELRLDYLDVVADLVSTKKHGIKVNPKAKYTDWVANYELNLLLMGPAPIASFALKELNTFEKALLTPLPTPDLETFLKVALHELKSIPYIKPSFLNTIR